MLNNAYLLKADCTNTRMNYLRTNAWRSVWPKTAKKASIAR